MANNMAYAISRQPYPGKLSHGNPRASMSPYGRPQTMEWVERSLDRNPRDPRMLYREDPRVVRQGGLPRQQGGPPYPEGGPQYQEGGPQRQPLSSYFWLAIISCFICCPLTGVVAVFFAWKSKTDKGHGDMDGAYRYSRCALYWSIASIIVGLLWIVLTIVLYYVLIAGL